MSFKQNTKKPASKTSRTRTRNRSRAPNKEKQTDNETETEIDECPECTGNITLDEKHGERCCEDCGLVIDTENIDRGPEWRAFNASESDKKSRVGSPTNELMHDKGLATNIDWKNKDAYGRSLGSKQRQRMNRLRKMNRWGKTKDAKDRNLRQALGEIDRMASALGVPRNVRKIASSMYRQCLDKDMLPGRSIEGMATGCLYASARMNNIPRSLDEMEQVSRVDKKEFSRAYRYIQKELGLEISPADPAEYLPRFVAKLNDEGCEVSQETERLAKHFIEKIKENEMQSGKTPTGIAAAAIYTAGILCNETPTQSTLSKVTGVTEVTIRERYQDIAEDGHEDWIHGA